MRQALIVIHVQRCFDPPPWQIVAIADLASRLPTVATIERHDEEVTPFRAQLGWAPAPDDEALVPADRIFVKHGYLPPHAMVAHLRALGIERALVCGIQAETCCLAAGFQLFDAGLRPTLLQWLTIGSSLDRSGGLGARLWRHHFGSESVIACAADLAASL
jgi:nicotinamidase-related amidase